MGRTSGRATPTKNGTAYETDSDLVPYSLVARLEALETRALLARIEGLEARAAGAHGPAGSPRVPGPSPSELRTADSSRNRSHDETSQLRLQIAGLTIQVAKFEAQAKGVRRRGQRKNPSRWRFWPGRRH